MNLAKVTNEKQILIDSSFKWSEILEKSKYTVAGQIWTTRRMAGVEVKLRKMERFFEKEKRKNLTNFRNAKTFDGLYTQIARTPKPDHKPSSKTAGRTLKTQHCLNIV